MGRGEGAMRMGEGDGGAWGQQERNQAKHWRWLCSPPGVHSDSKPHPDLPSPHPTPALPEECKLRLRGSERLAAFSQEGSQNLDAPHPHTRVPLAGFCPGGRSHGQSLPSQQGSGMPQAAVKISGSAFNPVSEATTCFISLRKKSLAEDRAPFSQREASRLGGRR